MVPGDATPPTVSTESVLITTAIDAHEGSDIGICNTPCDFISAYMDEDLKIALRGRLSEIMVNIAPPIYRHHVIYEKGMPVLYVTLKKVLYVCIRPSLIFYECLVADMR